MDFSIVHHRLSIHLCRLGNRDEIVMVGNNLRIQMCKLWVQFEEAAECR